MHLSQINKKFVYIVEYVSVKIRVQVKQLKKN